MSPFARCPRCVNVFQPPTPVQPYLHLVTSRRNATDGLRGLPFSRRRRPHLRNRPYSTPRAGCASPLRQGPRFVVPRRSRRCLRIRLCFPIHAPVLLSDRLIKHKRAHSESACRETGADPADSCDGAVQLARNVDTRLGSRPANAAESVSPRNERPELHYMVLAHWGVAAEHDVSIRWDAAHPWNSAVYRGHASWGWKSCWVRVQFHRLFPDLPFTCPSPRETTNSWDHPTFARYWCCWRVDYSDQVLGFGCSFLSQEMPPNTNLCLL